MFEGGSVDAGPPGDTSYQQSAPNGYMGANGMQRPPFCPPYGMMRPQGPGGYMGGRPMMGYNGGEQKPAIDPNAEIWVETKTAEGKIYFYNAKTRASAWTRPTGDGVQVLTQEQVEQLAKKKKEDTAAKPVDSGIPMNTEDLPPGEERPPGDDEATNGAYVNGAGVMGAPAVGPYGMRPAYGMTPYGAAPYGAPRGFNGYPGGYMMMPGASPYGAAPGMYPTAGAQVMPAKDPKEDYKEEFGSTEIDAEIKKKAEEFKEYKTPEGKAYYHSSITNVTSWEKPQALLDLEKEEERVKDVLERIKVWESTKKAHDVATAALAESSRMATQLPFGGFLGMGGMMQQHAPEKKEEKPKDKTKPVSSTPVPGTPWCVVWTGDEKVFYFNATTRKSEWNRPVDLMGRSDVDKLIAAPPADKKEETPSFMETKKPVTNQANSKTEEPFYKKMKLDEPEVEDERLNKPVEELVKEDPSLAEKKAAKERDLIPLEERMTQFKQMLEEAGVSAFSTWKNELHKIVFDPRYLILDSNKRKQVFEKYCCEKVDEERKQKKQKAKQLKEAFRELLEESKLSTRSTFSDFASKHGKDDRFKGVDKMREKENLFNDYIADLKRRERDERAAAKDKLRKDFLELLKEQKLDRHSSWTKTKELIREDPRYQAIESSSTKEDYFREHCLKLSKSTKRAESGERSDSEERQKKERIQASIRQREKEVAESLSSSLKQIGREREIHKREEALQNFQALLTDLVRTSDISWHDAKKMLKKDHRYESVEGLEKAERERLFDAHISALKKKKKDKFKQMLTECTDITINMPFKDARKYFKDDPRYTKYSSSEHKCEKVYKDWMKDQVSQAKNNFRALLAETKLITYKSKKNINETTNHLNDIISVLEKDKRFLVLSELEEERSEILMAYIDDLDSKGVPPPPTASDPSRRPK